LHRSKELLNLFQYYLIKPKKWEEPFEILEKHVKMKMMVARMSKAFYQKGKDIVMVGFKEGGPDPRVQMQLPKGQVHQNVKAVNMPNM